MFFLLEVIFLSKSGLLLLFLNFFPCKKLLVFSFRYFLLRIRIFYRKLHAIIQLGFLYVRRNPAWFSVRRYPAWFPVRRYPDWFPCLTIQSAIFYCLLRHLL